MRGKGRFAVVAALLLVLAVAPQALGAIAWPVLVDGDSATARNGKLRYTFAATTHTPVVGAPWTVRVTARKGPKPAAGKVSLDVKLEDRVVGHMGHGKLKGGKFSKTVRFPEAAAGAPLTVVAAVTSGGSTQFFEYPITVAPAAQ